MLKIQLNGCIFALLNQNRMAQRTFEPVVGAVYQNFTVISLEIRKGKAGHRLFHVKCNCGDETFKSIAYLRRLKDNYCVKCKGETRYKGIGNVSGSYFISLQKGCVRRSQTIDFNLTIEYIAKLLEEQKSKCALSGLEIVVSRNKSKSPQTASLDRIDSTKGYIAGNVQWIHKDINTMKGSFPQEYFKQMCNLISQNHAN